MEYKEIQQYLREHELDGWLLADFHGRNDIAVAVLELADGQHVELTGFLSRRSFCFIPAEGEPVTLVNPVEQDRFAHLPGKIVPCRGYRMLETELQNALDGRKKVAMEYSPLGRLPYIGLVEAGTVELVRGFGTEIVSSADLVAHFQARLDDRRIASHKKAAQLLIDIKTRAFEYIADSLKNDRKITEYDVCRFILGEFDKNGLTAEFGPNCSVDAHAGDPHYEPSESGSAVIEKGRLILIDLWAKEKGEQGVYGDITWMAYAGTETEIPERFKEMFAVLVEARDAAVAYLKEHIGRGEVFGADVDDACRQVVIDAGYGDYFTHRTGHSITAAEHGPGPNIDNLETEDKRLLQPGHLFSVEPGIYRDDCGFRTEIDVLITGTGVEVTTLPLQTEITALF